MKLISLLTLSLIGSTCVAQVLPDPVFNALIRTPNGGWIAGDATYSVALPDSTTLWLFGDSFIGTALPDSSIAPGAHMIRNCAVLQQGDSMTALYNGTFDNPLDFFPPTIPDSTWFWPEHGLLENDTLKLFLSEFITVEGVPGWNFQFHDTYLAFFSYPELELLSMQLLPWYAQNQVMYGNQVLIHGSYTYIYGRRDGPNNVANAHVARVPTGLLQAPWEFYTGSSWSPDAGSSAWITFQAVSQQYAVNNHAGKFILLTQQIWLGSKIYTMTSGQPEGPWGNLTEVYETPLPFATQITYNAWTHPQFDANNELLVSYNSNGDFWSIFSNVELYRPSFIRVPYQMIDPTFLAYGEEPDAQANHRTLVLYQNHPNPVRNQTTIRLDIHEPQWVHLGLYTLQGEKAATLAVGEFLPGRYEIPVDMATFAPGVYLYQTGDQIRKLIRMP